MPSPESDTRLQPAAPAASAKRRPLLFIAALYCAWISAGDLPWRVAYEGARSPTDFTRDFVAARVIARGERLSTLDGARGNAEAVGIGAEPVIILGNSPFHLHPPPASLPLLLLVPFGFRGASAFWLGLSILVLGIFARLLVASVGRIGSPTRLGPLALFAMLLTWPPTLTNIQLGQWSILLATLIAAGHAAWENGHRGRGAAWLAGAAAIKLTPGALFPFLALRDRRAAGVFAGTLVAALLISLPLCGGLDAWSAFFREARPNVAHWQTWWHNTLSIQGLLARLLIGGQFARPVVSTPRLASVLYIAASVGLALTALTATRAHRAARVLAVDGAVFAMWNVLVVVLNPLAWPHYALLLVLPAALVWRATEDPTSRLSATTRRRLRRATGVAIVGLTVPKETILLLVRPFPSSPLAAPLLSVHLFAALVLFGAATWVVRASRLTAPVVPAQRT